ncbi:MAG: pseudouridine synthase [Leptospiraceae bacterium]|nr:pseudouridine synthase [Leptospiraceae bacterium]
MLERIDKAVSNFGIGSRAEVKLLIKQKKVKVNGDLVLDPGFKVRLDDKIEIENEILDRKEFYYFLMNKPPGCITATEDSREKTVMEYLPNNFRNKNLFPIGRLDKETEGLLLFTNDGKLGFRLTSPKSHVEKKYYARVTGKITASHIESFKQGIVLDDGYKTKPAFLEIISADTESEVYVKISEGKFRQIRRMFTALGEEVIYLKRVKMGTLELEESLSVGMGRELTEEEVTELKNLFIIVKTES